MKEQSEEWLEQACKIKLNPFLHSSELTSFDFKRYSTQNIEWWVKICEQKFPKIYISSEYYKNTKGEWDKPWFKIGGPMNDRGGGFAANTWQGWVSFIIFLIALPVTFYLCDKFYLGSKIVLISAIALLTVLMSILVSYKGAGRYYRKKNGIKLKDSIKSASLLTWVLAIFVLIYVAVKFIFPLLKE